LYSLAKTKNITFAEGFEPNGKQGGAAGTKKKATSNAGKESNDGNNNGNDSEDKKRLEDYPTLSSSQKRIRTHHFLSRPSSRGHPALWLPQLFL
jgi:hypothetical protein